MPAPGRAASALRHRWRLSRPGSSLTSLPGPTCSQRKPARQPPQERPRLARPPRAISPPRLPCRDSKPGSPSRSARRNGTHQVVGDNRTCGRPVFQAPGGGPVPPAHHGPFRRLVHGDKGQPDPGTLKERLQFRVLLPDIGGQLRGIGEILDDRQLARHRLGVPHDADAPGSRQPPYAAEPFGFSPSAPDPPICVSEPRRRLSTGVHRSGHSMFIRQGPPG